MQVVQNDYLLPFEHPHYRFVLLLRIHKRHYGSYVPNNGNEHIRSYILSYIQSNERNN